MRFSLLCLFLFIIGLSGENILCQESKSTKPLIEMMKKRVDVNGDGKDDYLTFACYRLFDDYMYNRFVLEINRSIIVYRGEGLRGKFRIVDINPNDKYKEIAISEDGYSDDFMTYFFCYKEDSIILVGELPGRFTLTGDGSGIIYTQERGKILHTWFYPAQYKLNDKHRLEFVEQDQYVMNHRVTLRDTLELQKSPTDSVIVTILYPGEKVTMVSTDNKKWCLIETDDGLKGWFAVERYDRIVGTGKRAYKIFDGLSGAD